LLRVPNYWREKKNTYLKNQFICLVRVPTYGNKHHLLQKHVYMLASSAYLWKQTSPTSKTCLYACFECLIIETNITYLKNMFICLLRVPNYWNKHHLPQKPVYIKIYYSYLRRTNRSRGRRGHDRMVVGFASSCATVNREILV
jgi:hypothetical protein